MKAIVLAAGKGTRLHSEDSGLPKVLHPACGRPLLGYVLDSLAFLPREDIAIVVGYRAQDVMRAAGEGYVYCLQREQLGTGHAANAAAHALRGYTGTVLVCYGDMPLFRRETYRHLFEVQRRDGNACTVLTGVTEMPLAYGRVIRDAQGNFLRVVEERDCTCAQKKIRELNVGVYAFDAPLLFETLGQLRNDNRQREYYLTDVPGLLLAQGRKVGICTTRDGSEILGVNTPEDLVRAERYLAARRDEAK